MAKVARDARELLGALHANVEGLRSGFAGPKPSAGLAHGLRDIETCCERLNNMLEDALVGVRREGLTLQRSSVSLASVVASAMRQVRSSAEAKSVSFSMASQPDVAGKFDRTLLTRALVKLMGRIIAEAEAETDILVAFRLEGADVSISFVGSVPISESPSAKGASDGDSELDFCHLVAECHGGTLTIGSGTSPAPLYRFDLPWVT